MKIGDVVVRDDDSIINWNFGFRRNLNDRVFNLKISWQPWGLFLLDILTVIKECGCVIPMV